MQGLQSAVAGAMTAQQAKFGAITQQLGAAVQGARDAAATLQRQTEELQAQLAAATSSAAAALDATAGAAADGFQVSATPLPPEPSSLRNYGCVRHNSIHQWLLICEAGMSGSQPVLCVAQAAQAAHVEHLRTGEEAAARASEALGAAHSRLAAALQQQADRLTVFATRQEAEAGAAASAIMEAIDAGGR